MSTRTSLIFWRVFSTFICVLLGTGCASMRTVDLRADYPEAQSQIAQRLHEVLVAAEEKQFDRLDSYHFYGPKFTKFSGASPSRLDAEATRSGEHTGLASLKDLKMRADDLKVDVFGAVGIATFTLDYSFAVGDQTVRRKDRSTLVFVKDGGDWRIAHEHLSPITLSEPGADQK
jgi:ketosteroid isomerase-like protein